VILKIVLNASYYKNTVENQPVTDLLEQKVVERANGNFIFISLFISAFYKFKYHLLMKRMHVLNFLGTKQDSHRVSQAQSL
jgi:hypothetical protein